jgi:L-fucose mutarotase
MLKGIDPLIGPDLLRTLAAMGHGDELLVVDRNYPAESSGRPVHRLDGVSATAALTAVLSLLPLDGFVEQAILRMAPVGDHERIEPVQAEALAVAESSAGRTLAMGSLTREEFYRRARTATAVVATGEDRPYGCFVLVKGVLPEFVPGSPN